MRWLTIARKEFDDAVRSRMLWAIVAVFGIVTAVMAAALSLVPQIESSAVMGIVLAGQSAQMLAPITALVAAYLAIAGERESGSIKMLLGLPPTRGEVVLGKVLGRSAVIAVGLTGGFLLVGPVVYLVYGGLPVGLFAALVALTVALGVVFVAIAVGISAATSTRSRAMTLSIATYLAVVLLWDAITQITYLVVAGTFPGARIPVWYALLESLSPVGAYDTATNALVAGQATGAAVPSLAARLEGGVVPFYLSGWFMLVILAVWAGIPLALGYLRFSRADLA